MVVTNFFPTMHLNKQVAVTMFTLRRYRAEIKVTVSFKDEGHRNSEIKQGFSTRSEIFSTYFFMQRKPMWTWLKPAFFRLLWLQLLCKFASLKSVLCTVASQASSCLQHGCLDVHHCLCEFV